MMASAFVVGYSVGGMFPSYLQKDLGLPTGYVALPIMLQSLMFFLSRSSGAGSAIAFAGGLHHDHRPGDDPDRGAGDGHWLLLSSGGDLLAAWWVRFCHTSRPSGTWVLRYRC